MSGFLGIEDEVPERDVGARAGGEVEEERAGQGEVRVLDPDNPLMSRFQDSLKDHLTRQSTKLSISITTLDVEVKKRDLEKQDLGQEIFKEKEDLHRQMNTLNINKGNIKQHVDRRIKAEKDLHVLKNNHERTKKHFKELEAKDEQLKAEVDELSMRVQEMRKLDEIQKGELTLSKQMLDKTQRDKVIMAIEKQRQDMVLLRLTRFVARMEEETKTMLKNIESLHAQINELDSVIVDNEVDLKALAKESTMVSKSISQNLILLSKMDDFQHETLLQRDKVETYKLELEALLGGLVRASREEMYKNESMHRWKEKRSLDLIYMSNTVEAQLRERQVLIASLSRLSEACDLTENDYEKLILEGEELRTQLDTVVGEVNDVNYQKREVLDRIMERFKLRESTFTKAARVGKKIRELALANRAQEVSLQSSENKVAELLVGIEDCKCKLAGLESETESDNKVLAEKNKLLDDLLAKEKKIKDSIDSLDRRITTKKRFIEANEKSESSTPLELKLKKSEELLGETLRKLRDAHTEWLGFQNDLVLASEKRSNQLLETNTTKKHLVLFHSKLSRIDDKITELQKDEENTKRDTLNLQNRLQVLHGTVQKKAEKRLEIVREAEDFQQELLFQLQKEEETTTRMESDNNELEGNNEDLAVEVRELQRELLAWEKKWIIAEETKRKAEEERAATGELGLMKQEIHRMEVRYSGLKKVQERLISDLEASVERRDSIMEVASMKQKLGTSRCALRSKINSLQITLKKANQRMKEAEKEVEDATVRKDSLIEELTAQEERLNAVEEAVNRLEHQIQEGRYQQYKILELTVARQKKTKLLEEVKAGRWRGRQNLDDEEQKANTLHDNLLQLTDSLFQHFPHLSLHFTHLKSTLALEIEP